MFSNKRYIYTMLMQNSKSYWKFLIGYLISLLLSFIIFAWYDFSTTEIILTIIYIICLWIVTTWLMVIFLKKLFSENKFLNWKILDDETQSQTIIQSGNIDSSIPKLAKNIEEQFIKYWYQEISRDEKFTEESRVIIENTIKMMSDVFCSTDKSHLTFAVGNIILRHLKEFRRTIKFKEKSMAKISESYRYSFSSMPTQKLRDYYIHQMTKNVLVNFIHWELWNSIPCQIVVSILSNKLSYLLDLFSNPDFINYYLLRNLLSEKQKTELNLDQYAYVKIEVAKDRTEHRKRNISQVLIGELEISSIDVEQKDMVNQLKDEIIEQKDKVEQKDKIIEQKTTERSDEAVADSVKNTSVKPQFQKPRDLSAEGSFLTCENVVKVYEPKSATKTWNEVFDLESITLGEDPLGSVNSESSLELDELFRTASLEKDPHMDDRDREISSLNNNNKTLLEEVKHMTSMEGLKSTKKTLSDATANTLRDIKDFQENTVNTVMKPMSHATSQALHKIGDLQDEAAGVVEGLFDFGMAGLRKGLKLTGLQENAAQGGTLSENNIKQALASPGNKNSVAQKKIKRYSNAELAEECVWVNPLQNNLSFDEDVSNIVVDHGKLVHVPSITMDPSEYESPDPEYEEAADLATTIAKLRSLLQQKSSSDSTSTTPVASPMISEDTKSMIDLDEVDSFVPSFYKLCAKTATGVFNNTMNTIKTALPVNANEIITYDIEPWDYGDAEEEEVSLLTRMNKLLHERKDFCMIETAYDAFDSQEPPKDEKHVSNINFQDELDEFEAQIPLAKTLVDIICELIAESDTFISQEPFVKFILLVLGKSLDRFILTKVEELLNSIRITELPTGQNQEVLTMDLDVFVDYLVSAIPDALTFIIGHSIIKDALTMLVSSMQVKKCNLDVILQVFEFIALRLMEESSKKNSLYST